MHRDTQIGLAMSIVLIGFAAALCFPRLPPGQSSLPLPLSDARRLDAAIEQLPVRAYTPAAVPRDSEADSTAAARRPRATEPAPVAPAIEPVVAPPLTNPVPLPAAELTSATGAPMFGADSSDPFFDGDSSAARSVEEQFHVVESGDTLSGIAQQYLGSVADYPEIFAANRDQLDSPDDLKLGMRLRIPAGRRAGQAAPLR
jgi:nucleoid-associated protein YgaU